MNEISSAELAQWIQRGLHIAAAAEGESVDFNRVPTGNSRFVTFSVRLPYEQSFVITIEEVPVPAGRFFIEVVDVEEMADLLAWKGVTGVTLTPVTVGLENGRTEVSVRGDVTQVFRAARLLEVDLDDVEVY